MRYQILLLGTGDSGGKGLRIVLCLGSGSLECLQKLICQHLSVTLSMRTKPDVIYGSPTYHDNNPSGSSIPDIGSKAFEGPAIK
jgi:hypothetical protein